LGFDDFDEKNAFFNGVKWYIAIRQPRNKGPNKRNKSKIPE
jgi:hypothetical protein